MELKLSQITAVFYGACLITCCVAPMCFECSQDNTGCGDRFSLPNSAAKMCLGTCMKLRGIRYDNSVRRVLVTRTCFEQRDEGCQDYKWGDLTYACACNSDYCNAGHRSIPAFSNVFYLLAVWLLHRLCWQ